MIPTSIRWRLPLSYAAIALLAALSLGIVLLMTLRSYYLKQELDYLSNNAQGISLELARMVEDKLPLAALQAQLKNFSFLTQSRVRLLDANEQVLVDSGPPQDHPQVATLSVEVEAETGLQGETFTKPITDPLVLPAPDKGYASFIYIKQPGLAMPSGGVILTRTLITRNGVDEEVLQWQIEQTLTGSPELTAGEPDDILFLARAADLPLPPKFISFNPAVRTPYGFGLHADIAPDGPRSDQVVSQPFYDTEGKLLGYAELSQGPAYGREILVSVAWGWAMASGVAVALAAGVGWFISRRLSAPLLTLTNVTTRMAEGELSARATVIRADEVGQLAHSFNHMADQVEETVTTLRRFVADAAHELHTPLTALRTNLELVGGDTGPDDQRIFIERAQEQVGRLESLTRDLLDLSRFETGTGAGEFAPLNLNDVAQEISEIYASRAEQAGLAFSMQLPDEPMTIRGHESQLHRAIGNLLDNALKFTPEGGAISFGLRRLPGAGQAELWVEDTGIGIPPDDLPQLFSRFHRGRNAAAYPGSGLGLAIVKAIAETHQGQVEAENTGHGARFLIRWPAIKFQA
jgi:signal transduction histidine kinase